MKKIKPIREYLCHSLKKTLMIMRIVVILLLIGFLQTHANDAYSQKTKLSVEFSDTRLVDVLDQIENKSEFFFFYNEKLIDSNRKVTISVKDQKIEEVLKSLFNGTNVSYSIIDRKIILTPAESNVLSQQQKSVSGKVTDSSGSPLSGVSVVIKGTTTGMITDTNGSYLLPNVPENATLQFSFVGMKGQEVAVAGKSTVNVTLVEDAIGIDEVVAVGYGTMQKKDITGSVSQIKSEEIRQINATSVGEALQGKLPANIETRFKLRKGYIGLQNHGKYVEYKNVCIKELPSKEKVTELFNGKDLMGWVKLGDANWSVSNGEIVATGGDGWLVSEKELEDYELCVFAGKYENGGTSGIYYNWNGEKDPGFKTEFLDWGPNNKMDKKYLLTQIINSGKESSVRNNGVLIQSNKFHNKLKNGKVAIFHSGNDGLVKIPKISMKELILTEKAK